MFHGPTCAFKDFGAGFMGRAIGLLGAAGERLVILTATSGDTGSAVAHGFYGVPGVDVVVLYPEGKISRLQECQMTALGGNIHPLRVAGTFDDCQRLVKELFADAELRKRRRVTSANSINLLRWIPQAFYYFYGYCRWRAQGGDRPVIVVPSGNYGNLAAGMLAQRMGLPVGGFVAASNINDVVPEFLRTGVFRPRPSVRTPADGDGLSAPRAISNACWGFAEAIPRPCAVSSEGFRCDDACIRRTIDELYERHGYFSDPHSAVGYAASMAVGKPGFYLSTAHPAKFGEVIASVVQGPGASFPNGSRS
ncbi:MAG: threonine synthase [Alistipes senegalensis]